MSAAMRYVRDSLERRKRPLIIASSVIGGIYALSSWGLATLKEAQSRMGDDRRDREKFAQNQDDVAFTVLALLPTLADQLWSDMDVEGLTKQLQKSRVQPAPPQPAPVAVEQAPAPATAAEEAHGEEKREAEEALGYSIVEAQKNEAGESATAFNGTSEQVAEAPTTATAAAADAAPESAPEQPESTAVPEQAKEEDKAATAEATAPAETAPAETAPAAADALASEAPPAATEPAPQQSNGDSAAAPVDAASLSTEAPTADSPANALLPPLSATAPSTSPSALTPTSPPAPEAHTPNGTPIAEGEWLKKPIARNAALAKSASGSSLDAISEPPPPPIAPTARLSPVPVQSNVFVTPKAEAEVGVEEKGEEVKEHKVEMQQQQQEQEQQQQTEQTQEQKQEAALLDKKAKLELWNELKVVAFSRTITSLYALVLLTLQTSIQLNMLGRRSYVDSVSALFPVLKPSTSTDSPHRIKLEPGGAGTGPFGLGPTAADEEEEDEQTRELAEHERLFLTFSWFFLHRGWAHLAHDVKEAVRQVFANVPLKQAVTHAEFMRLVGDVRRRVEFEETDLMGGGEKEEESTKGTRSERSGFSTSTRRGKRRNFLASLFPSDAKAEIQVLISAGAWTSPSKPLPSQVRRLLDETKDLIDSRDFRRVLALSLDRVFGVLDEALRPTFSVPNAPPPGLVTSLEAPGGRFREIGEDDEEEDWYAGKRVRLANLFPVVAKQSTLVVHGVPNVYAESMAEIKELKAFTAIIYTAWNS